MPSDARKFRFVSPGIFINEIDQSQIPTEPDVVGPVIVGRAQKGPGMIPTRVNSFSEFVQTFGNPVSGYGGSGDGWRDGFNYTAPTYAAYAAQAYLRAGVGPVTFMRLMGTQSPDATGGASNTGFAGWQTDAGIGATDAVNGGSYGLFVFSSASAAAANTGTLAAVWYLNEGSMVLSGTMAPSGITPTASAATVMKTPATGDFRALIFNASGNKVEDVTFNMAEGSKNFIRNVFNTDPTAVNSNLVNNPVKTYWLGETFEGMVGRDSAIGSTAHYGTILAIATGSTGAEHQGEKRYPYRDAHSGWFFDQNFSADTASYLAEDMNKLFKFVGINGYGSWLQRNIKISINNVKAPNNDNVEYGSFDVEIRKANDSDLGPVILERFSNCNLDPRSANYVARLIGDVKFVYDEQEDRYREFGDYPNRSEYVRVVLSDAVKNSSQPKKSLPFGIFGPPKYPNWTHTSGAVASNGPVGASAGRAYALGGTAIPRSRATLTGDNAFIMNDNITRTVGAQQYGASLTVEYPEILTRVSCSNGADGADPVSNAYFGLQGTKTLTSPTFDPGYADYLRPFGMDTISDAQWADDFGASGYPGVLIPQFKFSLDEVVLSVNTASYSLTTPTRNIKDAAYVSGSMSAGNSWNASSSTGGAANFENVLNAKINRFTSPMFGGYDGVNIKERDPFGNHLLSSKTEETSYEFYSIRRAVRTIADPEVVEMNIASLPGITNASLTKYLIDTCEARGDALAIIDVEGGFTPRHESSNNDPSTRQGEVGTVITKMKERNLNSSYGAAYYPWVKVRDDQTGTTVPMPPSVVALGVLANTERAADVWFAPAGFRRGGLSFGAGGLTVTGVETKLTSRNRDDLYEVNVNPIASFPAEGIVVFGQKTVQATQSALDRINVRRLLIFLKRGVSQIASTTLFQPNVQATWSDFKQRADRFLGDVQVRFGLTDFKVVLDETTTTPDLVDRNILYAKIFVKPARAIEFIAIDFIITRSGASFDD